ncbi:hypothetical protein ACLOJK_009144 [Asimina triloba]
MLFLSLRVKATLYLQMYNMWMQDGKSQYCYLFETVFHRSSRCSHSLKTQQLFDDERHSSINGLVSSFVRLLQEENPSRERTIVRTAEKLRPFSFNNLPETDSHSHLSTLQRHKLQNAKRSGSIEAEVLCPICGSPLSRSYVQSLKCSFLTSQKRSEIFAETCCSSCQFQIVPKDPSSVDHFHSLLPRAMTERVSLGTEAGSSWLREQIKDCLLSDDENEVEVQSSNG